MKKKIIYICWVFISITLPLYAQQYPKNPNKTDAQGKRQGTWTILYDKDWEEITDSSKVGYYRVITYQDDKPIGKVRDYYQSGQVQMEFEMSSDRPKPIYEGNAKSYREDGSLHKLTQYEHGKMLKTTTYNLDGTVAKNSYSTFNNQAYDAYNAGDMKKAETLYAKAYDQAILEYGKNHIKYAYACKDMGEIYEVLGTPKKSVKYYQTSKELFLKSYGKDNATYGYLNARLGLVYNAINDYKVAKRHFIIAKDFYEKTVGKNHPNYGAITYNMAVACMNLEEYTLAEKLLLEGLALAEKNKGVNSASYANNCSQLGQMYENLGKYKKAEKYFVLDKEITEKVSGKENIDYITTCNNLAGLYKRLRKLKEAKVLLLTSKALLKKIKEEDNIIHANIASNLAGVYYLEGDYTRAEELYLLDKQITAKHLGTEDPKYAITLNELGSLYEDKAQYKKAEAYFIEAKNIREKVFGTNNTYYASSCSNLGQLYQKMAQYNKAEPLLKESLNICKKVLGKLHIDYILAANNLALLYQSKGIYDKAVPYLEENIILAAKIYGKLHPHYGTACNNLANIYQEQGLLFKAEPLRKEHMKIIKHQYSENHPDYGQLCSDLGSLYIDLYQFKKAEKYFLKAKKILETTFGKNHTQYGKVCSHLGFLYSVQKKYAQAYMFFEEAKKIKGKLLGEDHPSYALSCLGLAKLTNEAGNFDEAVKLCNQAKQIIEKKLGKKSIDYGITCISLASIYFDKKSYAKAIPLLEEGIDIVKRSFDKNHPNYIDASQNLAICYTLQDNKEKAIALMQEVSKSVFAYIELNFSNLSEYEKGKFLHRYKQLFEYYNSFYLQYNDPSLAGWIYNNILAFKGRLFYSVQKIRETVLYSNDEDLQKDFKTWQEKKQALANISQPIGKEYFTQNAQHHTLRKQINELEKKISSKSAIIKQQQEQQKTIKWQDIQAKLNPNEVAIEMTRFNYFDGLQMTDSVLYAALIIKPESQYPEVVILPNGNALEDKYLEKYNNSIQLKQSIGEVYNQYWKAIAQKIKGEHNKKFKVYFSPDGVYHQMNLNILQNPISGKYVIDEFDIRLVTNTKDIILTKPSNLIAQNAVLFGRPQYNIDEETTLDNKAYQRAVSFLDRFGDIEFSDLKETEVEVKNIEKILKNKSWKTSVYLGKKALEEEVKAAKSPRVLHIATHGFFIPNRDKDNISFSESMFRSGIVMAGAETFAKYKLEKFKDDGILTAYEAMNLYLDNTELVVLSACETGLGDVRIGEGLYGLQRALKVAGARYLIMSLWKVNDKTTQELMTIFYERWAKTNDLSASFNYAQKVIRKKYKAPYYWGAFILLGE